LVILEPRAVSGAEDQRLFPRRASPLRQAGAEGERRDEREPLIEMQIAAHFFWLRSEGSTRAEREQLSTGLDLY